jgi:hypothetical protein
VKLRRRLTAIVASALIALLPTHRADAQIAEHYRGAARNSADPHSPASLELSMFSRSDTLSTGRLSIGEPLVGSGITAAIRQGPDSIVLVSASASGDTIVWFSPHPTDALGGDYRIIAGQYAGQRGEWSLRPDPVMPGSARLAAALALAVVILAVVFWLARRVAPAYWRRRLASPSEISDMDTRDWTRVGGWLAFFVLGGVGTCIYLLFTTGEVASTLGRGTWMLGAAVPRFRIALFVEGTAHFLQLFGTVVGLVLLFRRSPLAPTFWVAFMITSLVYAIYDLSAVPGFQTQLERAIGSSLDSDTEREITTAASRNLRVVGNAILWSAYWMSSKRVRARFAPVINDATATEPP